MDEQIQVIGCGLPRTGSYSLKLALKILLRGDCHHGFTLFTDKQSLGHWLSYAKCTEKTPEMLKSFIDVSQYVAGVDVPYNMYYKDVSAAYPHAKVILTIRDNAKKWVKSAKLMRGIARKFERFPLRHVYKLVGLGGLFELNKVCGSRLNDALDDCDDYKAEELYHDWIEEVKSHVPENKLLVFNVKQGWEPLCSFLNVPVPESDFPKANDAGSLLTFLTWNSIVAWLFVLVAVVVPILFTIIYSGWN